MDHPHHRLQVPLGGLLSLSGAKMPDPGPGLSSFRSSHSERERKKKSADQSATPGVWKTCGEGVELKGVPSWSPAAHSFLGHLRPHRNPVAPEGAIVRVGQAGPGGLDQTLCLGEQSPLLRVETSEGDPMWEWHPHLRSLGAATGCPALLQTRLCQTTPLRQPEPATEEGACGLTPG